ncbi:unnamed protein product [Urochloa humidicola]
MADGNRHLVIRRSPRLMRMKKLSACASEQDLILMLKREIKALIECRREEWALEDRVAAKKVRPAGEEAEPAARAGKKKVVKRKVSQGLIDIMILNPHDPWNGYPEEKLGRCSQKFHEFYAKEKARADKVLEYEHALIKQFHNKGYAEDYTEVTDDDEDEN